MSQSAVVYIQDSTVARTIRFPVALRQKINADADRCGRSFDGQVIALLRRHYGEDVDIAQRLLAVGLRCGWPGPDASVLHLWHPYRKQPERVSRVDAVVAVNGLSQLASELASTR